MGGANDGAEAPGTLDLDGLKALHANLAPPRLVEEAIARGEARLAAGGALVADTGAFTGRSPKDKVIVRDGNPRARSGGRTTARSRRPSSRPYWPTSAPTPAAASCSHKISTAARTRSIASACA